MAKSKANSKKHGLIYCAILLIPVIAMVVYGIIAKNPNILPFLVAYALIAVVLGFFFSSKKFGMAAITMSIIFVLSLTSYIVADGMLQKTSLITDKSLASSIASILNKFPANITQEDLDKVKYLSLEITVNYDEKTSAYYPGYSLAFGYDDAVEMLKKQEAESEAQRADPDYVSEDESSLQDILLTATSEKLITDFSSLENFKNLEYLSINGAPIEYYYYYGVSMDTLILKNIKDLNFVENMPALKYLSVFNTTATDFAAVGKAASLKNLIVQYSEIKDASSFSNLLNLEYLDLTSTLTSDISFISPLVNLKDVYLRLNDITDVSSVKLLPNLRDLSIEANSVEDISSLVGLTSLQNLNLSTNSIKDISPLGKIVTLERVNLAQNQIENISELFSLKSLLYLDISENGLTDISGIENCTSLENLYINGNEISDISYLSALTSLATLSADNNHITDLSPIAPITGLTGLSVKHNEITDISVIRALENLSYVYLDENYIEDLTIFTELENAGITVSGNDNQIDPATVDEHDHSDDEVSDDSADDEASDDENVGEDAAE